MFLIGLHSKKDYSSHSFLGNIRSILSHMKEIIRQCNFFPESETGYIISLMHHLTGDKQLLFQ